MEPSSAGKILLVDDDPDIVDIYKEVLGSAGYKLDIARDGEEGYIKITEGGYDLILLDIMMPKIDGISVLKKLKENPTSVYNGSIFVLSQLNQEDIIKQAIALGAKGYIVKSNLTPDQVLTKISQLLQHPS